jgi:hypothetical protein
MFLVEAVKKFLNGFAFRTRRLLQPRGFWKKRGCNFKSTLFVLVRYRGFCGAELFSGRILVC